MDNVSVKFSTDSKHDVMHNLSSWQLAVVSLAFNFAMNKTYQLTGDKIRFINIDDPIQEMDALNIHSFIELMRHEFLDYKLIMSTHNDMNALYMKYKFEKLLPPSSSVNIINVQNAFYGRANT